MDGIRKALEWAGLDYDFGWFAKKKFGDAEKYNRICTFRSRKIKERSSRPILSGEFPLYPSCRAGHFHSRQSERLDLYKHYAGKLIEVGFIESLPLLSLLIYVF